MRVGLLPMGDLPTTLLSWLSDALASFGIVCAIHPSVPVPARARDPSQARCDADAILRILAASPHEGTLLAVTAEDLGAEGREFVFGLASARDGVAIVSLARLEAGEPGKFRDRLRKEAVHEIGHTLGLDHCANPGCVMYFSATILDTDEKRAAFCGRCRGRLPRTIASAAGP